MYTWKLFVCKSNNARETNRCFWLYEVAKHFWLELGKDCCKIFYANYCYTPLNNCFMAISSRICAKSDFLYFNVWNELKQSITPSL